ncbi:hypothetical protein TNCV_2247121 [Trichonephila clavipes]|nr:hypothetical protein TNCV_2247121 [Trichonephila clavipes]
MLRHWPRHEDYAFHATNIHTSCDLIFGVGSLRSQTRGESVVGSNPGATEDPKCRGDRCSLKLSRLNVLSFVWCDNKERKVPSQVTSSSLDKGSKLRVRRQ